MPPILLYHAVVELVSLFSGIKKPAAAHWVAQLLIQNTYTIFIEIEYVGHPTKELVSIDYYPFCSSIDLLWNS